MINYSLVVSVAITHMNTSQVLGVSLTPTSVRPGMACKPWAVVDSDIGLVNLACAIRNIVKPTQYKLADVSIYV